MIVYLNGEFLPLEQARVSPLDRGFLFGDGVYEVIPVYSGKPFRLIEHLERMERSMGRIGLANPHSIEQWSGLVEQMLVFTQHPDQCVYVQVTRGVAPRDHAFPSDAIPTVFMMSNPMRDLPVAWLENGAAAVSAVDDRWYNCDIKSTSLLGNVLARQKSAVAGAAETILFRDGVLTEASTSNVLIVQDAVIVTPPKSNLALAGTTLEVVLELAARHGMPLEQRHATEAEVRGADEIWLTSATKEVLPVTLLDGRPVGTGKPGPVWKRMHAAFLAFRRQATGVGASA